MFSNGLLRPGNGRFRELKALGGVRRYRRGGDACDQQNDGPHGPAVLVGAHSIASASLADPHGERSHLALKAPRALPRKIRKLNSNTVQEVKKKLPSAPGIHRLAHGRDHKRGEISVCYTKFLT
jgi:hypothetical protein